MEKTMSQRRKDTSRPESYVRTLITNERVPMSAMPRRAKKEMTERRTITATLRKMFHRKLSRLSVEELQVLEHRFDKYWQTICAWLEQRVERQHKKDKEAP
jgi:hypothetical protein